MRTFLAVTSLRKSYGGPAFSVSQLAGALADAGVEVGLWAPDGSAADSDLVPENVVRLTGAAAPVVARFAPHIVHDNGIWLAHNHTLAATASRLAIPRVVSTRGMLEPWALRHKGWKKRLAWHAYQRRDLRAASALHATAEVEARNLATMAIGPSIHTLPNGIAIPERPAPSSELGSAIALFMGRLYPVKGLPMLIEAWARVRPPGWRLRLAGPDEAGHQAELETLVRRHRLDEVVEFAGPVSGRAKADAFEQANLFILPSHSESFGMAAGEALAHGVPVLTTTAVPWPMLQDVGCGWRVAPSADGLAEGLQRATATPFPDLEAMGRRGRALIGAQFSWPAVAEKMTALYESLLVRP